MNHTNILAAILIALCCTSTVGIAQELPDDSQAYHLVTVTVAPPSPAGAMLLDSLDRHPLLARIGADCKRFDFNAGDEIYKARYAAALPPNQVPVVALVRSDGGVIFKSSGPNCLQGDALAESLLKAGRADRAANPRPIPAAVQPQREQYDCPDGNCPLPPNRRPLLPFDGSRIPQLIPDTVTVQPQVQIPDSIGYALAAVAVLFVLGLLGLLALAGLVCGWLILRPRHE